jgi:UbiD family decarboxylase
MQDDGLRSWLKEVRGLGELREIEGADWDLEIGGIADLVTETGNSPAVLFDCIKGYPKGYRVLINSLGSMRRLGLSLGMLSDVSPLEFVRRWREKSRQLTLVPPRVVEAGPILENVSSGKEVDLFAFPAPRWFELDGGRYIGTGSVNITRDPDEGWVNLGTARVMVHDARTVGFYIAPGRHGRIHRDKAFARGEPFKVAISLGHDPLIFLAGALEVPYGVCEYDFIGGILGRPVEVIEGRVTGLPIPAAAEIVLEGECIKGHEITEGPFGEWTGYYGSSARPEPVIKIQSVAYRNDPIILGYARRWRAPLKAALVWDDLEKAGVPDIQGVWYHEAAGAAYLFLVVSLKQRYPGHARQAGIIATQCHAAAYLGRYTVVVDEDIDPSNLDEVLWAICTRSDPEKDIEILRRCWSGPLDPIVPRERKGFNSRAIIDATRPFEWREEFPLVARSSRELKERLLGRWGKILFGS